MVAVEGTAGVGKSALVVHAAHRLAAGYPDGQVYVNLRGYGPGEPRERRSSLELLLGSVGVGPDQMPPDTTAREALWRTCTAGRRLLVVLDNARATTQVRPLLPGTGARAAWRQALADFERQGHLDAVRVRAHLADLDRDGLTVH